MPDAFSTAIDDPLGLRRATEILTDRAGGYTVASVTVDDRATLATDSVAYHWVDSGNGEVHLPAGHLTQEGDGPDALPREYRRIGLDHAATEALDVLRTRIEDVTGPARPIIDDLVRRIAAGRPGEISSDLNRVRAVAGDLTLWATGPALRALRQLLLGSERIGLSERTVDGWEAVRPGDLLITSPDRPLRLRGRLRLWRLEDQRRTAFPSVWTVRRLRHLRDTAGGCGPGEEVYRRLALPWRLPVDGGPEEGDNRINSHVVNIVERLSRTHFHPDPAVHGGSPQWELYVVLDPRAIELRPPGGPSWLDTFPDVADWSRWTRTDLRPGSLVVIPPNTGHRGVDVLANVVAIPGFKPGNEIYVDDQIAQQTDGTAPHNQAFAVNPAYLEGAGEPWL